VANQAGVLLAGKEAVVPWMVLMDLIEPTYHLEHSCCSAASTSSPRSSRRRWRLTSSGRANTAAIYKSSAWVTNSARSAGLKPGSGSRSNQPIAKPVRHLGLLAAIGDQMHRQPPGPLTRRGRGVGKAELHLQAIVHAAG